MHGQLTVQISAIAQAIQASVAPVFLLAGIGAFLNVLAGRLSRVVDRARDVERLYAGSDGEEHMRHVAELRILDRRISLVGSAIFICVTSAVLICVVVSLLFVAVIADLAYGDAVAILFIAAMALLATGLGLFLFEIRVATRSLRIREDLLEWEEQRRRLRL